MIVFKSLKEFNRGIVFNMLVKGYKEFLCKMSEEKKNDWIKKWEKNDQDAFNNIDTIGRCYFVTCDNDKIIGFASYDPRQEPEMGIIGDNVVLPEFRGKGYGKMQIQEILRIFKEKYAVKKVVVSTGVDKFFISAQKQYLSCGFKEIKRFIKNGDKQISYEINLIK